MPMPFGQVGRWGLTLMLCCAGDLLDISKPHPRHLELQTAIYAIIIALSEWQPDSVDHLVPGREMGRPAASSGQGGRQ